MVSRPATAAHVRRLLRLRAKGRPREFFGSLLNSQHVPSVHPEADSEVEAMSTLAGPVNRLPFITRHRSLGLDVWTGSLITWRKIRA